jgi:hypothetical protein
MDALTPARGELRGGLWEFCHIRSKKSETIGFVDWDIEVFSSSGGRRFHPTLNGVGNLHRGGDVVSQRGRSTSPEAKFNVGFDVCVGPKRDAGLR